MLRFALAALWICLVTAGSSYAAFMYTSADKGEIVPDEFFGGLDYVKSSLISVPIVSEGAIQGYVIAQFVYTADGKLLRKMSVPPDLFLLDEAFRAIYVGERVDFENLKKYDLAGLKQRIADNLNERFGSKIIHDVLIEQFNYVPKDKVRYGPQGRRH